MTLKEFSRRGGKTGSKKQNEARAKNAITARKRKAALAAKRAANKPKGKP